MLLLGNDSKDQLICNKNQRLFIGTKFFDEGLLAGEVGGEIFFTGGDDEFGFFGYSDEFELQVDELLLLRTDLFLEFLGVFEETLGCWDDRILFDFPELSELSDDVGFAVE